MQGLAFEPRVLWVALRNDQVPEGLVQVDGTIVFQLLGLSEAGTMARRFALGAWGSCSFDISAFRDVRLVVLGNSFGGLVSSIVFDVVAMASDGQQPSLPVTPLYPETVAAGTYSVPWGASEMQASVADGGFAWLTRDTSGGLISLPTPVVTGTVYPVMGTMYTVTAPFSAVWRVRQ